MLGEATAQGISGKAVTPFVLARIHELTRRRSLATNMALVKHNAEVGARLALVDYRRTGANVIRQFESDAFEVQIMLENVANGCTVKRTSPPPP